MKGRQKAGGPVAGDDILLEPSLIALRKQLAGSTAVAQETVPLLVQSDPSAPDEAEQSEADVLAGTVSIHGTGATASGGCLLSKALLQRTSAYYQHAASFGEPPAAISLDIGHRGVRLLAEALISGSAVLGPATLADFLQAASYLQVGAALQAASLFLQRQVLDSHPAAVLRVALDLGLSGLQAHIEHDFLQDFFMLSGEKAAVLLKEWAPPRRRELLASPLLCAPTECCLVETLCHLAKHASSADAVPLLDCIRFDLMTAHEAAGVALFVQHNAKWVDKRLSTALAWRLLNARIAGDLADRSPSAAAAGGVGGVGGSRTAAEATAAAAAEAGGSARPARRRSLLFGLSTARLAGWSGTTMYCTAQRIACSWDPPEAAPRPMVLQLEREDPRHAAAEAVSGTSGGGGGGTSIGGSGWDLQISLYPEHSPPGFKAVCFAFGTGGLFWCPLGPLSKAGPTWWKVGFLASQLPRALPQPDRGLGGGGSGDVDGGLVLVGWWVPQQ